MKSDNVSDVSDVSLAAGNRGGVCAQCQLGGGKLELVRANGRAALVHSECCRFWLKERGGLDFNNAPLQPDIQDDGLDIPDWLRRDVPPDRRPGLGPEGDSLDDLR
jgi:hypothetical protein